MRNDYAVAERYFERAAGFFARKAEVFTITGNKCRTFASPVLAEKYLRKAAEQKDASAGTFVSLAELYERIRKVDDASALIKRALELDPSFAPALLAKARFLRQANKWNEAEQLIKSFLNQSDRETRARAFYELGSILDRQGRYDDAMTAFLEAKAILRPDAPPHAHALKIMRERLELLRKNLSREILDRWLEAGNELGTPFRIGLLCGHPRSGTTLLEQVLDSHPDAVSIEETEIFHNEAYMPLMRGFPEGAPILDLLQAAQTKTVAESRNSYFQFAEKFLGSPIGGRLLIDKNPSLTFLIPQFLRIFPELKILVALRDPRDVCLSCFMQPFFPIGQTSSAYLSLEGTVNEYTELMQMWRTVAPMIEGHFIQIRYEDMVDDLESVSRQSLDFLGLTWDERVLRFNEHAGRKMVRSPTYADVTQPVFKRAVGRWRNYEKYLAPQLEKLEPFVKAFGYE
jgi:tetratricopeptide (TPR) repeat protein